MGRRLGHDGPRARRAGRTAHRPELAHEFVVSDLRNPQGEVGTLDYSEPDVPRWSIGRSVALVELAMTGLAEVGEKTLRGRSIECPNCGAALEVMLPSTQSVVCPQCRSVVDLSQGVGADLRHYAQAVGTEPLIPLGSVGTLALGAEPRPWQVVGYVERCEVAADAEGDQSFWREYLLYDRMQGFAFIVDAQDGWSWTVPITGVPSSAGSGVKLDGVVYRKLYDYTGMVTYVLGEFYWQVTQNQRTLNTDYQGTGADAARRLNREQTGTAGVQEVVWSLGETLAADVVRQAFGLDATNPAAMRRDALPTAFSGASLLAKIFFVVLLLLVVLLLFRCSGDSDRCDTVRANFGQTSNEYQNCVNARRSGGGYGGYGLRHGRRCVRRLFERGQPQVNAAAFRSDFRLEVRDDGN